MRKAAELAVALLITLLGHAGAALCQTTVTTVGTSGNWTNTGIWNPSVVPNNGGGNTYDVQILNTPAPVTVTLDTNITVNSLTLQSGTGLSALAGTSLTLGALNNAGNMEFTNANTLTVNGTSTIAMTGMISLGGGSTANFNGDLLNNGNFYTGFGAAGGNSVSVTGNLTNNGSFVMFGSNDTLNVTGALINNGIFSVFGAGDVVNVGSLVNSGTGAITITVGSGGTLNLTGGGPGMTDIVAGSSLDIGGTFNVINGGIATNALANLTSVEGNLTLENGQTTVITPGGSPATLTLAMGSMVDVDNGSTLTIAGNVVNSGMLTLGANGGPSDTLNISGSLVNKGSFSLADGTGDVANVGSLVNTGSVYIGQGATLNLTGGGLGITDVVAGSSLDVAGNLTVTNGGITTSGLANLTNVGGLFTLENGASTSIAPLGGTLAVGAGGGMNVGGLGTQLNVNGDILSSGSIAVIGTGNTLNLSGNLTSGGAVLIQQGNALDVGGAFQQTNGSTTIAGTLSAGSFAQTGGVTAIQSSGNLAASTVNIAGGTLQGTGLITGNLSLTGGTLTPDAVVQPGTLTLNGNYIQGPGGTLLIDISGTPAGQFSVFNISGSAQLDGTVNFMFLNGFTPTIGDIFTFLTFGSVSGDFSNIVFTNFTCPVGAVCEDVFGAGTLSLEILPDPPPGQSPVQTPEPASSLLLASGLLACCGYFRKRART